MSKLVVKDMDIGGLATKNIEEVVGKAHTPKE